MASTSQTNAAAEPRTTSDDGEQGQFFTFGRWLPKLVALGLRDGDAPAASPRRARAHAAGHRP